MRTDAVVFGSLTVDTFLSSSEFEVVRNEKGAAVCQQFGAKIEIDKRVVCGGGGGGNVAVGLSRLGLKTSLLAKMGNDFYRQMIIEELKKDKVDTSRLIIEKGETDAAVVLVSQNGGRTILIYRGETKLEKKDICLDDFSASWFHVASLEGNLDLARTIFEKAAREKTAVCWNPGKRELENSSKVGALLSKVEILILNQEEAEGLLGGKMESSSFWPKAFSLPAKMVFVTQGRKGAFLVKPEHKKKYFSPAIKTDSLENTGAGDAFCSGVIAARFYQRSDKETLLWGLANGAGVVSKYGAKAGLLTRAMIERSISDKL